MHGGDAALPTGHSVAVGWGPSRAPQGSLKACLRAAVSGGGSGGVSARRGSPLWAKACDGHANLGEMGRISQGGKPSFLCGEGEFLLFSFRRHSAGWLQSAAGGATSALRGRVCRL